jgi:anti-sigma regulatory factor (Ser/Thr protein kinase)
LTVELQFPSRSVYVGVARLAVAAVARAAGLDEEQVFDLKTAVSEAIATAVLKGEDEGGEAPISLSWEERPDSVVIEVGHPGGLRDEGGDEWAEREEMSLALLRSLVHECEFVSEDDGHTTIRLVLQR